MTSGHLVLVVGAAAFWTQACTHDVYPGPRRPEAELAEIQSKDTVVAIIDGKRVVDAWARTKARFRVLPGRHVVGLVALVDLPGGPGVSRGWLPVCVTLHAGRTYETRPIVDGDTWEPQVIDMATSARLPVDCARWRTAARRPAAAASPGPTPPPAAPPPADTSAAPAPAPAADAGTPAAETVATTPPAAAIPAAPPAAVRTSPAPAVLASSSEDAHHPGTGLGLRFGFAFGGDTLVNAQLSNGNDESLAAGQGLLVALDGMLTPFWIGDRVGFGAGGEVGWKYDSIDASNASVSLMRFPFMLSLHALIRASDKVYFRLAGGVEKHLGIELSGSGDAGGIAADFYSTYGGTGELALYYEYAYTMAFDVALRFTRMRYGAPGGLVDASNAGLSFAIHYNF